MEKVGELIMGERLSYIDDLKGIAIMAVTLAHILDAMWPDKTYIQTWCYSWELAAFFIAGGFLFGIKKSNTKFLNWFKKGLLGLGWPYITFSIIYILFNRGGIKSTIFLFGIGALWFLPTYFVGRIGIYVIENVRRPNVLGGGYIVLSIIMSIIIENFYYDTVWRMDGMFVLTLFARFVTAAALMYVGFILSDYINKIKMYFKNHTFLKCVCCLIFGGAMAYLNTVGVNLRYGYFGNPILFYISAIFTVLGFIMLFSRKSFKMLEYFGKNSITIFLLQNAIVQLASKIVSFVKMDTLQFEHRFFLILIIFVVVMMGAILFTEIVNRTPLILLITPLKKRRN